MTSFASSLPDDGKPLWLIVQSHERRTRLFQDLRNRSERLAYTVIWQYLSADTLPALRHTPKDRVFIDPLADNIFAEEVRRWLKGEEATKIALGPPTRPPAPYAPYPPER